MGDLPWIEKYRPKTIDDIVSQTQITQMLKEQLKHNNFPNLLLYGPPGTGKTSAILNVTHKLFGEDIYNERVLKLNASDERGIKIVRGKIREFSQKKVSEGLDCNFKIIILDEADAMTDESQYALRRIMEKYSSNTRFCIICNYINRIIQPLISRCCCLRFKPLKQCDIAKLCCSILKNEKVEYEEKYLKKIVQLSVGDLRKTITNLQKVSKLNNTINKETYDIAFEPLPTDFIENMRKKLSELDLSQLFQFTCDIYHDSYGTHEIILNLFNYLTSNECSFDEGTKSRFFIVLMECDTSLNCNSDEFLQLLKLMTFFKLCINKQKKS